MTKTIMVIFFFILYNRSISQTPNCVTLKKVYLDSLIKSTDFSLKIEKGLYIIKNFPYEGPQIDSILRTIRKSDLLDIRLLRNSDYLWANNPDRWIVVFVSKYRQKKRVIKSYLKEGIKMFECDSIESKPELYINDLLVDRLFAAQQMRKITQGQIFCINVLSRGSVMTEIFQGMIF